MNDLTEPAGVTPDDIVIAQAVELDLLAAVMQSEDGFDEAAELVGLDDFAWGVHGSIWTAAAMAREAGEPLTIATLWVRLRDMGRVAELGTDPARWLADLLQRQSTGTHARYFASKVRDLATIRRVKRAAVAVHREASNRAGSAEEVVAKAEQIVFDLTAAHDPSSGPRSAREMIPDLRDRLDRRVAGGETFDGLSSGFGQLDAYLSGCRPGQVIVVGARPGAGKTALAVSVAMNMVRAGIGTLFFSAEMPEVEITDRA